MNKWVFVRHKERSTWEIAGGHIEEGEDIDSAAERELYEETGAIKYQMVPICDYSVERNKIKTYGRLYLADVYELGDLEHEIEELCLLEDLPKHLTYEQIQPYLFEKVKEYINLFRSEEID